MKLKLSKTKKNRLSEGEFPVDRGIVATTRKGQRVFFFNTLRQDEVESAMTLMGYGCSDYYLSFATCTHGFEVIPKEEDIIGGKNGVQEDKAKN